MEQPLRIIITDGNADNAEMLTNEHQNLENALRESEERYRNLFENASEGIYQSTPDGRYLLVNPAFARMGGYESPQQMIDAVSSIGQQIYVNPEDRERLKRLLEEKGRVEAFETEIYQRDGTRRWISINAHTVKDDDGSVICFEGTNVDITERKRAEEALRKSEKKLDTILQTIKDGVIMIDLNGQINYYNPAAEQILNIDKEARGTYFKDRSWRQIDPSGEAYPEDQLPLLRALQERRAMENVEYEVITSDGTRKWISVNAAPLIDETGRLFGGVSSFRDVTERKRDERELQNHRDHLEQLVKGRTAELEQINIQLEEEIAERQQVQHNLLIAKDEAERANAAKSQFLANMSHEIRTPLNAVIGFSELLPGLVQSEEAQKYITAINTSGKSLLNLINDILDLSKIEADMLPVEYKLIAPRDFVGETMEIFKYEAARKQLALTTDIAEDLPTPVYLDYIRLRQVLVNLIGNAIKFTDSGSVRIRVRSAVTDLVGHSKIDLLIAVEDTGAGIDAEDQARLFDTFYQVNRQDYPHKEGTGLGLAISKRLVEIMNGEIRVESSPGQGSVFTVILHEVAVGSIDQAVADNTSLQWEEVSFKPATVLVVDDVESNRLLIKEVLESKGLQVIGAENGYRALEMLTGTLPNLIIADIRMPLMDGIELASILRDRPETAAIPIISLTASPQDSSEGSMAQKLFDSCLVKPIALSHLIANVARFLVPVDSPPAPVLAEFQSSDAAAGSPSQPARGPNIPNDDALSAALPILVVDDNELNLVLTRAHIIYLGLKAETCTSGAECLQMVRARPYSLIFMDYLMGGMNGLETAHKIKEIKAEWGDPRSIPIIAMTAIPETELPGLGAESGFDGWIGKPFKGEDLRRVIARHLQ